MTDDDAWDLWSEWLGREPTVGTIHKDIIDMLAARRVWRGFNAIVAEAPLGARKYGTFHSWFNASYARTQALAIRRQMDSRDDVISLVRLLKQVASRPSVITRQRYLERLPSEAKSLGNGFFDTLVADGEEVLGRERPKRELEDLLLTTGQIITWVNKEIAHYDPKVGEFSQGITFEAIHGAVDMIFNTMNRYQQFFFCATVHRSVLLPPWEANFREAWLPTREAWERAANQVRELEGG